MSYRPWFAVAVVLLSRAGPAAAQVAGKPAQRGSWPLVLEIQGGADAPLGAFGTTLALEAQRLVVGVGLGRQLESHGGSAAAFALFGRFRLLQVGPVRLSLGAGWSERKRSGSAVVSATETVDWSWQYRAARRIDGSLAGELPLGRASVRLEAGVGWVVDPPICSVSKRGQGSNGPFSSCLGRDASLAPLPGAPRVAPYALVALAYRPDERAREAPASGTDLRVFVGATDLRSTDIFSDGHFDDLYAASFGLDGELVKVAGRLRAGVAARYELGIGRDDFAARPIVSEHYLLAAGLLGTALPFARAGEALELLAGVGPAIALLQGGEANGSSFLRAWGLGAELMLTYLFPLADGRSLAIGTGVRVIYLEVTNGSGYFDRSSGSHAVVPLRVGLRWRG
jgi:hypothetical protein